VIAQSRFLPMADSAVDSAVRKSDRARYASLDDVAFRRALKDRASLILRSSTSASIPLLRRAILNFFLSTSSVGVRKRRINTSACLPIETRTSAQDRFARTRCSGARSRRRAFGLRPLAGFLRDMASGRAPVRDAGILLFADDARRLRGCPIRASRAPATD
jgi:hypothetical protein